MNKIISLAFMIIVFQFVSVLSLSAGVLERIVAIVDDDVILLSEYEDAVQAKRKSGTGISKEDVLDEMINSLLLLKEAEKFRIGADGKIRTEAEKRAEINKYIDRKIKAFIHIPNEDIEYYYRLNTAKYRGREIYDVRDEIEEYLAENELSIKLHEYIKELREAAYIRIQLDNRTDIETNKSKINK